MRQLILKKCLKCNTLVKELNNSNDCEISCCGEPMKVVKANSVDASFEKHIPTYEKVGDNIEIKVNHVMEEDHYIEWIMIQTESKTEEFYFKPNEEAKACVAYEKDAIIYSYCNKHGLWKQEVK